MNIRLHIKQVEEFHVAFRQHWPTPQAPDFDSSKTNALRCSLLREELNELADALRENNRVEQLDALLDIGYVLYGAVLAWGLRAMFEEIKHTTNLRKVRDMDAHCARMLGNVNHLEIVTHNGFGMQALTYLTELQSDLAQAVFALGFSPVWEKAFAEVHRSNMSKLWSVAESEGHFEKVAIEYDDLTFNANTNKLGMLIATNSTGKIIKSPSYSPASLAQFV